jgi:hypothetical protein
MNFLSSLIERHRPGGPASVTVLEPRLPSRFEPVAYAVGLEGVERAVGIETSRDSETPTPLGLRHAPRPPQHDGEPLEDLDPRVSALRSALSPARATVEPPALATMPGAPWTASPRTVTTPPAPGPAPVEIGESISVVATPPERARTAALEPALDRRPAPPVAAMVRVEREMTTPRDQPTIHVSIGRVDVRAVMAPAPPPARTPASVDRLSLEDYLHGRHRGPR